MDNFSFTGRQLASARTLAGKTQTDIADAAGISVPTLKRMEASDGPAKGIPNNLRAVVGALEAAGIEFIDGGVRLRDRRE